MNQIIKPTVILVRPQMGENIGAVARAMRNFGLAELRIVAPRDGWPNPAAEAMAAHGADIIHQAKVYTTLPEALADVHYCYALTARDRRMSKPCVTPKEGADEMVSRTQQGQKVALMFGPERSGLENEDVAQSQAIVTIPTDEQYASLNIAQSAVVMCYEWFQAQREDEASVPRIPAPQAEWQHFFAFTEQALDESGFFKDDAKKTRLWQNVRSTFQRAELTAPELRTLFGIMQSLRRK